MLSQCSFEICLCPTDVQAENEFSQTNDRKGKVLSAMYTPEERLRNTFCFIVIFVIF